MRMSVEKNMQLSCYQVYIFEDFGGRKKCVKQFLHGDSPAGAGYMIWEDVEEGMKAQPCISLPFDFAEDFINHLVEAMGDAGIKTEPHSYYEGKLEGKEEHIVTLKKLLGLDHDDKVVNVTIERKYAVDGDTEKSNEGRKTE